VRFDPLRTKRRLAAVVMVCAVLAGAIWIWWASNPALWWKALDYRRWLVPMTMPFFAMAFFEGVLAWDGGGREPGALTALRGWLGIVLAFIFAAVLLIQSHESAVMGDRLMKDVENYPGAVVPYSAVPWIRGTIFDHWGSSAYVMVRQGETPAKWFIDDAPESMAGPRKYWQMIPLCWFTFISPEPGPSGWFDLRPVHRDLLQYEKREGPGTE
jgi:hypothetical protein